MEREKLTKIIVACVLIARMIKTRTHDHDAARNPTFSFLPVVVLITIHSLLSRFERFCKSASKSTRRGSVLARRRCRAAITISITAVPRRCVKTRFTPCRTFYRWRRRRRLRSHCRWCGRWRRSCGNWRRWRWCLLDFLQICGRGPARSGMIEAFREPPSYSPISMFSSIKTNCFTYHCFLSV